MSDLAGISTLDLEAGDTMAVGESQWLVVVKGKTGGARQREQARKLADLLEERLAVEIEFCPVLGGSARRSARLRGCG